MPIRTNSVADQIRAEEASLARMYKQEAQNMKLDVN